MAGGWWRTCLLPTPGHDCAILDLVRWLTLDLDNPSDLRERNEGIGRIDQFWEEFSGLAPAIEAKDLQIQCMVDCVQRLCPGLMFEIGFGSPLELTLTPETERGMRPFVAEAIVMAPHRTGWQFFDRRPPVKNVDFSEAVESKLRRKSKATSVALSLDEVGRIETKFEFPLLARAMGPALDEDAGVWVETVYGEERLDHWSSPGKPRFSLTPVKQPIENSVTQFERLVEQQLASRPDIRWSENDSNGGGLFKMNLPTGMAVLNSRDPQLTKAQTFDPLFCSARFSRFGETFAYLRLPKLSVDDRSTLTDLLESRLSASRLGAYTGGETWPEHSLITLAINDLGRLKELRELLASVNLPRQSWLQFFDADLCDEWFGFPDDRVEPPKRG